MLAIGLDAILCAGAAWFALAIRLETFTPPASLLIVPAVVAATIAIPIFWLSGLYRAIFRHSGGRALRKIAKANLLYGAVYVAVFGFVGIHGVPRSVGVAQPMILFLLVGGSRILIRTLLGGHIQQLADGNGFKVILIYGAGEAGRQLAASLSSTTGSHFAGFIDDDRTLWNASINGNPVYSPHSIVEVVKKFHVKEIWLAMPTLTSSRRRKIIEKLRPLGLHIRKIPSLTDITSGKVRLSDVQDLDIDDMLGRDPVQPQLPLLRRTVSSKTVLVTGAGGSIGSELCRQMIPLCPKCLILLDNSEYALYKIHQELTLALEKQTQANDKGVYSYSDLESECQPFRIIPILASVTDINLLNKIFHFWKPDTVLHAAAYKHVPLVEQNVSTSILNNVWGTYNCARLAVEVGSQTFVQVSTDKAVRPTSFMGASKRLSELIVQGFANSFWGEGCAFSSVRFGNVLGSSGSVIPLFRDQIASGGPLTLTDLEITRYFMTISEASQLVLQAAGMARGGEVFILNMGQPVRLYDLARRLIEFSGFLVKDKGNPNGDIEIKVTGLRPGEKLYEELLIDGVAEETSHPKIMKAADSFVCIDDLEPGLNDLSSAIAHYDFEWIRHSLAQLVPEYSPSEKIVDWMHQNDCNDTHSSLKS